MRVVIDLETSSTQDLRKTGASAYAEHPDTRVTVLCATVDNSPVLTWRWDSDRTGMWIRFFEFRLRHGATFVAHNYLFEYNIWHHKMVPMGFPPIPIDRWSCTMARSLVAGYPASLETAAKAARLSIQKDASARDLMLRMARPRTTEPTITWWHETSPEHFQRLCDYCAQDVEAERALDKVVPELSPRERRVFEADATINQRGIFVDIDLVTRLDSHAHAARALAVHTIVAATNAQVTTPNQVARIHAWLGGVGITLPDLRRATVFEALQSPTLVGPARRVLQARLDASRSSTAKLDAIRSARSEDGRVRGTFQYYGANRTGRAAGRRLQPQNLFRGSIRDVARAVKLIKTGCLTPDLEVLFEDSAMGVVASCLRSCITAPPGRKLAICDFAQIEARVLAWLAGETYALECFERGDDIYTETAKAVGSGSRQMGKVLVLACGFGMGAARFQATAAGFNLNLSLMEAGDAVDAWRRLNKRIVGFWWECDKAIMRVARSAPGTEIRVGRVVFKRSAKAVLIELPSGRHLVYRNPHVEQNEKTDKWEFTYRGSHGGDWVVQRAWPGKTVENITQAVARDVLVDKMVDLIDVHHLDLIAQVHDELVAECDDGDADQVFQLMSRCMSSTVTWAPTLPLAASGFVAQRYAKP